MASKPYDKETENYYRLCCLLFEAGTEAMRQVFLKHVSDDGQPLPPNQFHVFMKQKKNQTLKDRGQKKLYKTQRELLFPSEGEADINKLDMTLLNILISNLCVCGDEELKKVTDLKNFRNDQAHKKDYRINLAEFVREWSRLSAILEALGVNRVVIDDYANKNINDTDREMIITKIQQVLEDLKERVGGVEERVDGMDERVDGMDERVDGMDERLEIVEQTQHDLSNKMMRLENTEENKFLSDTPSVSQSSTDALDPARIELSNENLNDLKMKACNWCDNGRINLNLLRVVISEFICKNITFADIVRTERTHELIDLLITAGYLKPTDIRIFFDVINLCGVGGVETVMKKEWNLPKFKDVPMTHFSDRRRKLLAFGRTLNIQNMITIGQLYSIQVNKKTDPYDLILKLEMKGYLKGENWNAFIEKLKDYDMINEVEALSSNRE